jgi:hypothetical protein
LQQETKTTTHPSILNQPQQQHHQQKKLEIPDINEKSNIMENNQPTNDTFLEVTNNNDHKSIISHESSKRLENNKDDNKDHDQAKDDVVTTDDSDASSTMTPTHSNVAILDHADNIDDDDDIDIENSTTMPLILPKSPLVKDDHVTQEQKMECTPCDEMENNIPAAQASDNVSEKALYSGIHAVTVGETSEFLPSCVVRLSAVVQDPAIEAPAADPDQEAEDGVESGRHDVAWSPLTAPNMIDGSAREDPTREQETPSAHRSTGSDKFTHGESHAFGSVTSSGLASCG